MIDNLRKLTDDAMADGMEDYGFAMHGAANAIQLLTDALKEAGDVIESYHKSTGVDLGDASRMPFYADTIKKIDAALSSVNPTSA